MNDIRTGQATPKEIKALKRRCWSPNCRHRAFLKDWGGWQWCLKHWYRSWIWGQEKSWYYLKTTKIF